MDSFIVQNKIHYRGMLIWHRFSSGCFSLLRSISCFFHSCYFCFQDKFVFYQRISAHFGQTTDFYGNGWSKYLGEHLTSFHAIVLAKLQPATLYLVSIKQKSLQKNPLHLLGCGGFWCVVGQTSWKICSADSVGFGITRRTNIWFVSRTVFKQRVNLEWKTTAMHLSI